MNPTTTFLSIFQDTPHLITKGKTEAGDKEIKFKRLLSLAELEQCAEMMWRYDDVPLPLADLTPYWGITFTGIPGQYTLTDRTEAVHKIEQRKNTESWSFYHSEPRWVNMEYCIRVFGAKRPTPKAA